MSKTATVDEMREAVRDCIEQDAVHGSAIHWDLGKDSDGNDRLSVTWGKSGEYTLIGVENNIGVADKFVYTVHDYNTGESIRFYADHVESDPKRWDDSGEPDFESEGLTTLANDLITMIDNPEYDLYGKSSRNMKTVRTILQKRLSPNRSAVKKNDSFETPDRTACRQMLKSV